MDSPFCHFQYFSKKTGRQFAEVFRKAPTDGAVIFHYGASHIQSEIVVTEARGWLQKEFGDGGRGLVFNYAAANTYSSINYNCLKTGEWTYAKSFMTKVPLPLGVMGMTVRSVDPSATLGWEFKTPLPGPKHRIWLFADNDDRTPDFEVQLNDQRYVFQKEQRVKFQALPYYEMEFDGSVSSMRIRLLADTASTDSTRFTFYGVDFKKPVKGGLVYHSLGVGAAPIESVLRLSAMPKQAKVLKPDIIFLDFGTNNILYTNKIAPRLKGLVIQAIDSMRAINPDVLVVLTTTQDLYRRRRVITAGVAFRDLMKEIAREKDCLFWNWFDLSGGLNTIRKWREAGYAQPDNIHLTMKGYRLKGALVHRSFINTLAHIQNHPEDETFSIESKTYPVHSAPEPREQPVTGSGKYHTIESGESLWSISRKYGTTVERLQELNNLNGTNIRAGSKLRIR